MKNKDPLTGKVTEKSTDAAAVGVLSRVGLVEPSNQREQIETEEKQLITELTGRGMLTQPGALGQLGKQLIGMAIPSRQQNYERRAVLEATAKQLANERGDDLGLNMLQTSIFSSGAPAQNIFRNYLRQVLNEGNMPQHAHVSFSHPADNKSATHFRDKLAQRSGEPNIGSTIIF